MLRENTTPYAAIAFEQWHRDGPTMAVVATRGRWRVEPDGTLAPEPAALVLSDRYEAGPHDSDLVRVSDLVPYRPATDVTVLGVVRGPEPAPCLHARLKVGERETRLRAWGPRRWRHERRRGWVLSEPEPTAEVPLGWAAASGGRVVGCLEGTIEPRNPRGPGLVGDRTPHDVEVPGAALDAEDAPVTTDPAARPEPRGWGPMPPPWRLRQRHAGTYDAEWRETRHPRLPLDFDYRFHQVAHPALILPGHLKGGETIETEGLAPRGGALAIWLPELGPWARFGFADGREVEAALALDGVHLDLRGPGAGAGAGEGEATERPWSLEVTWRSWMETCPSLRWVDLHHAPVTAIAEAHLPVPGPEGLREAA